MSLNQRIIMKQIHLLSILVIAVAMAIAGAGCSSKAKKDVHLQRADRWFNAGELDKAEIEYLNALQVDPRNPVAIGRLGVIYFDEGRFQKAAPYLYRGSQLEPNNLELHLKLAQIYLAVGMLKQARGEAEIVLAKNPQDTEAPVIFAQCAAKPDDINTAQLRLQTLAQNGNSAALETGMGILASRERNFKVALTHLQHALVLDSHFAAAYAALGNVFWEQNEPDHAAVSFKAAADFAPPHSLLQLQYGQFEIQSGNFAVAQTYYSGLTQQTPDFIPGWLGLAEVELDEKKLQDCAAALNKAAAMDPDNVDAKVLDARLDLANTNATAAIAELEQLARKYPQAPRIHYELGLAYISSGQPDKALNQVHEAEDLDPNFVEAAFLLAQLELRSGDTESAVGLLKQLTTQQPNLIQVQLLMADARRLQGDFNGALKIYQQLEKTFPQNTEIPLLAGATFIEQQNETLARQEFDRVLKIQPDNVVAQEELAQLDLADQKFAVAQDRVERIISRHPNLAMPEVLLAKIFLAEHQTNRSEMALLTATELPGGSPANFLLAQVYYAAGQDQKTLDRLNIALGLNPQDTQALMLLAMVQNDLKNYRGAADAYEKLLGISPQYSPALNNLAWLYCDNLGDLDKAYDLAQRARQLLPDDPSTADTLGWILFKKGQYDPALKLFQESANRLSTNPEVQFHLGMAHYMLDDEDASRQAFQNALSLKQAFSEQDDCQNCLAILNLDPKTAGVSDCTNLEKRISERPNDPIAFAKLAAIYQRDNNTQKAMALCNTVLGVDPQNVPADILLARLCASSDPARAFALAKAAYQLKPDSADVCETLGRMAFLNGNDEWAFNLLEGASQDQPNNGQTLYDYANAAFCVGKIPQAQTAMQNAVQNGLSAPQAADANNFLHLVALYQNPGQAVAAQSHVEEILTSNPDNPPALFADAIIQVQTGNTIGAEHSYETLLAHHPDCAAAQKNLVILYAQNLADPGKAYPIAVKAREAFPDDPQVTRAMGFILFQQGDYIRAVDLFNTISNSPSADAELFYYLGISEFRMKNFADSKRSLERALTLNLSGPQATDARETLAELKN